jgi:hypothetical protein
MFGDRRLEDPGRVNEMEACLSVISDRKIVMWHEYEYE